MSFQFTTVSERLPAQMRGPAITTWNRLEPRPRTADFSRSLRAEVHDALWMLARQWQFGEFKGDDAGSAVLAKVQIETTRITRYAQRGKPATAYDTLLPLETRVERESVPMDLLARIQIGQHWLRLLRHHVGDDRYRDLFRAAYPITVPAPDANNAPMFSNREAWQVRAAAAGRAVDGGALLSALAGGARAEDTSAGGLSVNAGDRTAVAQAAAGLVDTYGQMFNQPATNDSAWIPERLEYQFECSAPNAIGGQTVLISEEYYQGHLDWYAFDIDPSRTALADAPDVVVDDNVVTRETLTFIPTPVRFAGMPNMRWWEFEDGQTNFGAIKADTTDIAQLLLAEFGLIYGNDWLVFPYTVQTGSLCAVRGLAVTDVFGQRTLIRPAGQGPDDDWQRWTMFNLSTRGEGGQADNRLFVPPVVTKLLESPPVESVTFARDEMANMVWGVEAVIPDDLLGGMPGYEAALALVEHLKGLLQPVVGPSLIETDAHIRYVLGTSVPENWIPFIPVQVDGSNREVQLQRAQMLRTFVDPPVPVQPRGAVLRQGLPASSYYLFEEEVPRAGAIVTRAYQRTRWLDGRTYLWLGRRKTVGRGEGSSGLQFDQVVALADE